MSASAAALADGDDVKKKRTRATLDEEDEWETKTHEFHSTVLGLMRHRVRYKELVVLLNRYQVVYSTIEVLGVWVMLSLVMALMNEDAPDELLPDLVDRHTWTQLFHIINLLLSGQPPSTQQHARPWTPRLMRLLEEDFPRLRQDFPTGFALQNNACSFMADTITTANKNFASFKTRFAHVKSYVMAKYELRTRKEAATFAYRLFCDEPLDFTSLPKSMLKRMDFADWDASIEHEHGVMACYIAPAPERETKQQKLARTAKEALRFRFNALALVEDAQTARRLQVACGVDKAQLQPAGRLFNLMPVHSTGKSLVAKFDGRCLRKLCRDHKKEFPEMWADLEKEDVQRARKTLMEELMEFNVGRLDPKTWKEGKSGGSNGGQVPEDLRAFSETLEAYFDIGRRRFQRGGRSLLKTSQKAKWKACGVWATDGIEVHVPQQAAAKVRKKKWKKKEKGAKRRRKEEKQVATNARASLRKPAIDSDELAAKMSEEEEGGLLRLPKSFPDGAVKEDTTIIAIDGGVNNPGFSVRCKGVDGEVRDRLKDKLREKEEGDSRTCTLAHYDEISGRVHRRRHDKARTQALQAAVDMKGITQHHTKTARFGMFQRAIQERLAVHRRIFEHNNEDSAKLLKHWARRRGEAAVEKLARDFAFDMDPKAVVIAWGNGKFGAGTGRKTAAPLMKIKRCQQALGYTLAEVDESNTSKASVCCEGEPMRYLRNGVPLEQYCSKQYAKRYGRELDLEEKEKKYRSTIHGILVCTKCGTIHNRDRAGALNILKVTKAVIKGEARPEHLTHAYWRSKRNKEEACEDEDVEIEPLKEEKEQHGTGQATTA